MADTTYEIEVLAEASTVVGAAAAVQALADQLKVMGVATGNAAAAIADGEKAFANAAGAIGSASQALDKSTAAIKANKAASASAAPEALIKQQNKLSSSITKAADSASKQGLNIKALAKDIDVLPGPMGKMSKGALRAADDVEGLVEQLGLGGTAALGAAAGAIALAIGIVVATGAAVAGTAAILKWAFALNPKNIERLNKQTKQWDANIKSVFSGLKFDKLLDQFDNLSSLFSVNEASGKALKVVFESLFQPIVDALTDIGPKAERLFLQMEILALKALIAIKPFGSEIKQWGESFLIGAAVIVGVVVLAVVLLGVAILATVVAIGAIVAGIVWLTDMGYALGVAIREGAVAAFASLSTAFDDALFFLRGLDLAEIGRSMIAGLISGITAGAGNIAGALTGPLLGAVDSAKKALGIASPAALLEDEIAGPMVEGVVGPIDAAGAAVDKSLTTMVTPGPGVAAAAASAGAETGGASKGGSSGANFSGAVFNFYGVEGAQDAQSRFEEFLTRAIEGDVTQLGGSHA